MDKTNDEICYGCEQQVFDTFTEKYWCVYFDEEIPCRMVPKKDCEGYRRYETFLTQYDSQWTGGENTTKL